MEEQIKRRTVQKQNTIAIFALFTFALTFFLSYSAIMEQIFPISSNLQWLSISNISSATYNQQWMKLIYLQVGGNGAMILFSLIIMVMFFRKSRHIVNTVTIYFVCRVILVTFVFYFRTVIKGPITPDLTEILLTISRSILLPGIWLPYLMTSDIIAETYIN